MIRRVLLGLLGVLLVALGILDYHVQLGAIVVGLMLLGVPLGDRLLDLLRAARTPPGELGNGEHPRPGSPL